MRVNIRNINKLRNFNIGRIDQPSYLAVGSPGAGSGNLLGSVYIYNLNDLTERYQLDPNSGGLSLYYFDNNLYVGDSYDDEMYVYNTSIISSGSSSRTNLIGAPDGTDIFGSSISVSNEYVVIGALGDDDLHGNSGAAFVYDRSNLDTSPTKITPSGSYESTDRLEFGASVDISGSMLVIGAPSNTNSSYTGSVHIYDTNDLSTPTEILEVSDGKTFGTSVAINNRYLFVSDEFNDESGSNSGAVYIYDKNDLTSTPTKLVGDYATRFGSSISCNHRYLVVGASRTSGAAGTVYLYDLFDTSFSTRTQRNASDVQPSAGIDGGAEFGSSVHINSTKLVVGAKSWNNKAYGNQEVGAVYIFNLSNLSETPQRLESPDDDDYDWFGTSVLLF